MTARGEAVAARTGVMAALAALAAGGLWFTTPAPADASPAAVVHYAFHKVGDGADPTFNQLLAINDQGQIAGYFGSGADAAHPNRGYVRSATGVFVNENFPGAAQTQVIGINNSGTTCGFYADPKGDNFGFVRYRGQFIAVVDPADPGSTFNQVLGLNNNGQAVGEYNDAAGNAHSYLFNFHTDTFTPITVPGATSVTVTDINLSGTEVGFYSPASGPGRAFLRQSNGFMKTWAQPGASATRDYGINDAGRVVGSFDIGTGATLATEGFVRQNNVTQVVHDPAGITGAGEGEVYNGIGNNGDLIGFYVDAAGNTDGVVATP